jgi:hypothetical protein
MQKVKCQTLDTWAKENSINKINMLLIDKQGAEQKILSVSDTILNIVKIINTEVSHKETYESLENHQTLKKMFLKEILKFYYKQFRRDMIWEMSYL